MVRAAISRSYVVVSVGVLAACAGSAWGNPDTLQPPPGPITGTFKTLTEVEPRVIVNARNTPGNASSTFIISQPGSYYLDRNITGESGKVGIRILASDVTLDLNGFVLQGVAGATSGIVYTGADRFRLRNGTIRGWPASGVTFAGGSGFNNLVEDLQVSENTGAGLDLRDGVQVRRVKVEGNGGLAVRIASFSSIADSTIRATAGSGIQLFDGASIRNCYIDSGTSTAVLVGGQDCTVRDNVVVVSGAGGKGIAISGPNNVVEGNTITGQNGASTQGVIANTGTTGLTFRNNIVKGTADNYALTASGRNDYDLILSQIPETIDFPARVKLSGWLTLPSGSSATAITVTNNDVTIDLAGAGIAGVVTSGNGITVTNAATNLRVMNGTVTGFAAGIAINDGAGANGSNSIIENVHIRSNRREAVLGGNVLRMSNCTVTANGAAAVATVRAGDGATIENVNVAGNSNSGPAIQVNDGSIVRQCVVGANTGTGIEAGASCIVERNTVFNNGGAGIGGGFGTTIIDNTIRQNQTEGIRIATSGLVRGNKLDFNARAAGNQAGILIQGSSNLVEANSVTASDLGISISLGTSGNVVVRNWASANTINNYFVATGNSWGPIVNIAGTGNFAGVANSTHPQANFEH
ncbi:MAG: right-handed parallel beta-helix repeat-containing protein [Phycisphaerales bacterium]|nr:right-handed parallel beta-helix repeat-containing protein [Phycisphaerales bacterium]